MTRFKVGLYPLPPWMSTTETGPDLDQQPLFMDILNYYQESLNATVEVFPFTVLGDLQENGSWTDIFGMLQRGDYDSVMFPNLVYETSFSAVYTTVGYYYTWTALLYGVKNLQVGAGDSSFLVNTFDKQVWTYLFVSLLILSTLTTLAGNLNVGGAYRYLSEMISNTFKYLGLLFTEPFQGVFTSGACRILVGTWCVAVLILQYAYNGNLKSALANVAGQSIETLEDIVERPYLRVITFGHSFFDAWFRDSKDPLMLAIYRMIIDSGGDAHTLEEMALKSNLQQVADGKAVYLMDYIPLIKWLGDFDCQGPDFAFSEKVVRWHPMTLALNKRLPTHLTDKIDAWISMYAATGQLKRRIREMEARAKPCLKIDGDRRSTLILTMGHYQWAFFFYLTGVSVSFLLLIAEMVHARRFRHR